MIKIKERLIELEGTFNFRDLGGYRAEPGYQVKWGKLFRSGNLAQMTEEDISTVKKLGISKVIDLRDIEEIKENPNPNIQHLNQYHIPVIPTASLTEQERAFSKVAMHTDENLATPKIKANELMTKLYTQMVSYSEPFKQVFNILINQSEEPTLFHCMAGKDRTGVTSALILSVLGVDRETIFTDYKYTNYSLEKMKTMLLANKGQLLPKNSNDDMIKGMLEANPNYLEAFFTEIDRKYESMDVYFDQAIGIGSKEREFLKERYLEPVL